MAASAIDADADATPRQSSDDPPRRCRYALVGKILASIALLALVLTGLILQYSWLAPWGKTQLKHASTAPANSTMTARACIDCAGLNTVYPISTASHVTYSAFKRYLMNHGGALLAWLAVASLALSGGVAFLLNLVSMCLPHKRRFDCGILEMLTAVRIVQFVVLLGAARLDGAPRFWIETGRQLAWTNLQYFPWKETSVDPMTSASTGVARFAYVLRVKPDHLFYYTCVALFAVLLAIVVLYVLLRILLTLCNKRAAGSLDHRAIWLFVQLFVAIQGSLAMTACFQMHDVVTRTHAIGDFGLALIILAIGTGGTLVFGLLKIARHREVIQTYQERPNLAFHLRYSVYYRDIAAGHHQSFYLVLLLAVEIAVGAVIGVLQNGTAQLAVLLAVHAAVALVLIVRQPYLRGMAMVVSIASYFVRVVVLLLLLGETSATTLPQHARDSIAVAVIAVVAVFLMLVLVGQLGVVGVAVYRFLTAPPFAEDEMDEMERGDLAMSTASSGVPRKSRATFATDAGSEVQTPKRDTLDAASAASSHGFHAMSDDQDDTARRTSSSTKPKPKTKRSLYTARRTRQPRRRGFEPVNDDELPEWARV